MKTVGTIAVLLGLLGLAWLLVRDVETVTSRSGGTAVVEPVQHAKAAVDMVNRTERDMQDRIKEIDK